MVEAPKKFKIFIPQWYQFFFHWFFFFLKHCTLPTGLFFRRPSISKIAIIFLLSCVRNIVFFSTVASFLVFFFWILKQKNCIRFIVLQHLFSPWFSKDWSIFQQLRRFFAFPDRFKHVPNEDPHWDEWQFFRPFNGEFDSSTDRYFPACYPAHSLSFCGWLFLILFWIWGWTSIWTWTRQGRWKVNTNRTGG